MVSRSDEFIICRTCEGQSNIYPLCLILAHPTLLITCDKILEKTQMVAETQIKQAMDKIESLISGMTDNSELDGT